MEAAIHNYIATERDTTWPNSLVLFYYVEFRQACRNISFPDGIFARAPAVVVRRPPEFERVPVAQMQ